ncbi:MAG: putative Rmd1/YagE family protein [Chlamydiales bacterium]|jgi:uncharacterized Rmd1/YagE family protein
MMYQDPQNANHPSNRRCSGYCTADSYHFPSLLQKFQKVLDCQKIDDIIHVRFPDESSDAFIFPYGAVVFWGAAEKEERHFLDRLQEFENRPLSQIEEDEFNFVYGDTQRFHRDIITLTSTDVLTKLSLSHGIAQSVKLSSFESSVQQTINNTKHIPEDLARKGKISLRRKAISQMMGKLFLEKSSVNLHCDLLDAPDFFWENDAWEPVYQMSRNYLNIPTRIDVLNTRLNVVHDLFEILGNELNHQHSSALEWTIIWLIVIEIVIVLIHDLFNYL